MANTDRPYAFVPFGALLRQNAKTVLASYGTGIFVGDLVAGVATGDVNAAAADDITIIGSATPYSAASTATTAASPMMVADHPDQLLMAQDDGVSGSSDYADIYTSANHVTTHAGSTTRLLSGMEIDISDAGTSTGAVVLLDVVNREDNAVGANADWVCQLNVGEGILTVAGGV